MKNEFGLTPRQEKFAQGVASGLSQSEAYRQAYPSSLKWKDKVVWTRASQLASMDMVSIRVSKLAAAIAEKSVLKAAEVLDEVRKLAHSDIGEIMHPDGRVKLPHELDPATRAAVSSFKIDEYGRIEYKFWPKTAALDQAMKHLGLYDKDNAQKKAEMNIGRIELVPLSGQDGGE